MKKIVLFSAFVIFSLASAFAQINFIPKTGDAELDGTLSRINLKALDDLILFKKEMSQTFKVAESKVEDLLGIKKMPPADVFMTLQVAEQTKKPVDDVVQTYEKHKDKGWGEIAKEMGIKPGSKEFHALKDGAKGKDEKNKAKDKESKDKGKGKDNSKGKGKKK